MTHPTPKLDEQHIQHGVFRGLLLFAGVTIALWAFWLIFRPFLVPIGWALCLGAVTAAPYRWLLRKIRKPGLAALTMVVLVMMVVLGPIILVALLLISEASQVDFGPLFLDLKAQFPQAYATVAEQLESLGWLPADTDLQTHANEQLQNNLPELVRSLITGPVGQGALAILGAPVVFLIEFLITLVTLYFVYCESSRLRLMFMDISPLPNDETDQILESLRDTTSAAILGGVVVALMQGFLGGIMFAIADVSSPLLWGVVMAGFSLLPFGGTAIVWVPAAVYMFLTGQVGTGVFMMVFGTVIVGASDNIMRPWVLSRAGAKDVHPMLLFFAIISGLGLFGISGIVFGPLLLALLTTMVRIYRRHYAIPATVPTVPEAGFSPGADGGLGI